MDTAPVCYYVINLLLVLPYAYVGGKLAESHRAQTSAAVPAQVTAAGGLRREIGLLDAITIDLRDHWWWHLLYAGQRGATSTENVCAALRFALPS